MKLAILSHHANVYSTRRFVAAGRQHGHEVRVLDPVRCCLGVSEAGFEIRYKGKRVPRFDAVIPRIGGPSSRQAHAVLRQLQHMGCHTPNASAAIAAARDKWHCHQLLAAHGVATPASVSADHPLDTPHLLAMLGPPPHVIKLSEGTQGNGVMLAPQQEASQAAIDALHALHAGFLVQECIAEACGTDLRCLVIGDAVVAAIRRKASPGEFRSNLHLGGTAESVQLDEREAALAVRAAQVLGLGIAGVDLVQAGRGPLVLEVNASPGLEGIEQATGLDLAGRIVEWVVATRGTR
ncbi:RimK family alpha-L-glutamate ligase [Luteimonas vadosa]|uniref:30S ribosomal protein S6--L-glutamate ligase n=1 Tax=Luteimonas vadosa TaxID=1165507 RepID=A0ABP9E1C8_9GAMM